MLASSDGRARVTVVSFDGEDHIEFCRRIIEPFNGRQELIDHTGLASKRRDDAVHRPFLVRRNGERSRCRWIPRRHRVCDNPNAERYWQHYKNGKHDHARCRAHGGQSQYAEQKRDGVGDFVQRGRRKLWPRGLKLLGRANSGRDQHVVYSVPERSCTPPNADFHPPPNAHNFLEYDSDDTTDRRVDQKEDQKEGGVRFCRDGPVQRPVLEGAAHVGLHVALSRASCHHRGCGRAAARPDQYDARRFAEPLAKTHAAARAAAVRRHHRDHGDNLGHGPLIRKRRRRLTSWELRACIPLSLSAVWPFSSWPRSNRRWRLWRSGQHFRKLAQARRPARPKMRRRWQSSEYASGSPHFL